MDGWMDGWMNETRREARRAGEGGGHKERRRVGWETVKNFMRERGRYLQKI